MSAQILEERTEDPPAGRRRRRRGRRGLVIFLVIVVLLGAGAAAVVWFDPFAEEEAAQPAPLDGVELMPVRQEALSAQVYQNGTLQYVGRQDGTPYEVINQSRGIYTWVPRVGADVKCGQILYWVDDRPVPLLCGGRPPYRDLNRGDEGRDVKALNDNLVKLGYADGSEIDDDPDYFGWETQDALTELQDKIGAEETGDLDLGGAVFLPSGLRITKASARLGGTAAPGTEVAQATSTAREVVVPLSASQQSQVKVGNKVQVTLPDNRTTPGKVSRIGTVARAEGQDSTASTIPVYIALDKPKDVGTLDQAPVQVQITTAGVKNALIVPVTALVGQGDGFAVEKVDAAGRHVMVPVKLGLFDNADGLVQVTGELKKDDRVVVPSR